MNYQQCQTENREDARFCKSCGGGLEIVCPNCAVGLKYVTEFCDACGYQLGRAYQNDETRFSKESERKHVTVLFSDLCGYTAMSEKLDPEEAKEITGLIYDSFSKIIGK